MPQTLRPGLWVACVHHGEQIDRPRRVGRRSHQPDAGFFDSLNRRRVDFPICAAYRHAGSAEDGRQHGFISSGDPSTIQLGRRRSVPDAVSLDYNALGMIGMLHPAAGVQRPGGMAAGWRPHPPKIAGGTTTAHQVAGAEASVKSALSPMPAGPRKGSGAATPVTHRPADHERGQVNAVRRSALSSSSQPTSIGRAAGRNCCASQRYASGRAAGGSRFPAVAGLPAQCWSGCCAPQEA